MLSMITTFFLSKFDPPPWQPMLSMIQVQVLHSFFSRFLHSFYQHFPPPWQPNPCFQWLLHSFWQHFSPLATLPCFQWLLHSFYQNFPPLATHAFNDSGSSITFLLSTFLHSFHQHSRLPWQPNPCFQWLLHSFYQKLPPLPTQPMLSMITTFLLSKFDPPLGNPCFQWFRFKYCIPFIKIFTFLLTTFPSPLATQPMLSMITTFLLSTFDFPLGSPCFQWFRFKYYIPFIEIFIHIPFISISPPPWQPNPCFQWLLHSFYKHFSPLATLPCFQWLLHSFIKIPPPPWQPNPCFQWLLHSFNQNLTPPPLATHAFNDSGSSITFLLSRIWHSFYQNFPPPLGNPTHALNDYYIPFIKIWPPPLATHAFNDSGSSTTFLLSRFLHFFYQHFPFPLGNPTHAFNDYYIPFIKNSPPCQPNPCFQWLLHSFYQNLTPPPWQPMLSMIQVQVLHSFYQDFYIAFINISLRPLATQPMLSMITTFIFIKILTSPLATHAFNDSGSSTTFLLSTFLHSFLQNLHPPLGNPYFHCVSDDMTNLNLIAALKWNGKIRTHVQLDILSSRNKNVSNSGSKVNDCSWVDQILRHPEPTWRPKGATDSELLMWSPLW